MDELKYGDKVVYRYAGGVLTGIIIGQLEFKGHTVYRIKDRAGRIDYRTYEEIKKL